MSVKRYEDNYYEAYEHPNGEYVKYADYEALLARLRVAVAALKRANCAPCADIAHEALEAIGELP